MKRSGCLLCRKLLLALVVALLLPIAVSFECSGQTAARGIESKDRTLSPYFFVKSEDSAVDRLPLKSTSVTVNISGVIADVVVTQVYRNEGKKPIEALYVFPASTRASVYGMKMTIGKRVITAKVEKSEEARKTYQRAKQEGKTASLLEQKRPNVFQMNVANILPGDVIKTELRYTEAIVPADGVYQFVYPAVVGPRYSNQPSAAAPASQRWSQNPYLHQGESTPYSFDIKARVAAGIPIQEISCPSHKTTIDFHGKSVATVTLDPRERSGGNRDFILRYRLAGERIESGLLLYQGKDENFFLLTAQAPKRVTEESMPPREYIFIVDVSGSMRGFPLDISRKLMKELLTGLHPTDIFDVMTFAGASHLFSDRSVTASPDNIRRAVDLIRHQRGAGGTELLAAMKRALALPRTRGFARTIVIATDGLVTVEPEIFELIRKNLGKANIFAFGIGTSVNRYLIEGMARAGAGEPFVAARADEAVAMAEKFRKYVQSPVLTEINLDFDGFHAYDVEPSAVPDMFAERPVVVCGKWKGKLGGTITLSGLSGLKKWVKRINVAWVWPQSENSALRYLWARSRLARLSDYNRLQPTDERVKEITALGLKYNLLTAYTSFVAIDARPRLKGAGAVTVKQPLPLPLGVSDTAVGRRAGYSRFSHGWHHAWREAKTHPPGVTHPPAASTMTRPSEQKPRLKFAIESLRASAGLSRQTLKKTVRRKLSLLRRCLKYSVAPSKLTVKWTIDKNGSVSNVKAVPGGGVDKKLVDCIRAQVKTWSFPAPENGRSVHVVLILRLER